MLSKFKEICESASGYTLGERDLDMLLDLEQDLLRLRCLLPWRS